MRVVLILLVASTAAAQPAQLSPRNANYTIDATLDAASHTITGSELITWRNITTRTATDLQFHLYWNAWKHDRTTFMRERALGSGGGANQPARTDADRSRIDVTSLKLTSPATAEITTQIHFIQPDDGNTDDETVMAVPLPQPVAPGGSMTIEVKWTAHIPRPVARTGGIGVRHWVSTLSGEWLKYPGFLIALIILCPIERVRTGSS